MVVQESFSAYRIAANGTLNMTGKARLGGFIADAAGTLTLTVDGTAMLTAIPVSPGVFVPFPVSLSGVCSIVLAGGAAGMAALV